MPTEAAPSDREQEEWADLISHAAFAGISPAIAKALADRVEDYVGESWRLQLKRRARRMDCRYLAQLAELILEGKKKGHQVVGEAVEQLLPPNMPAFWRSVIRKIAEKFPHPWDAKLEAIARALQVIGVYQCLVQDQPLERCWCLAMLAPSLLADYVEQEIKDLLDDTTEDLRRRL